LGWSNPALIRGLDGWFKAGACAAAPGGPQRSGGRGRPGFLGSARNGRSPGEETSGCTVAARGKRRSRPLPTKAIEEAVGERGSGRRAQGDLARIGRCVQCPADAPCPAKLILWACRTRTRQSADCAENEIAPSRRNFRGCRCRDGWHRPQEGGGRLRLLRIPPCADPRACSRAGIGIRIIRSGSRPTASQMTRHSSPVRLCRAGLCGDLGADKSGRR
jgi:hypothetical protein